MAGMIPTFGPPRGAYTGGLPAMQGVGRGVMSPAQAGWGQPQQPPPAFGGAQPMQAGVMQGMGQRTLTEADRAQYRPQMMANALMGAPAGSTPVQLGNTGNWGYATPQQQAANAAPPPQPMQPMQAAPQQPTMRAAPMQPPRGYTR